MTLPRMAMLFLPILLAVACLGVGGSSGPQSVIGDCQPGMTLQAEEGCSIPNTDADDTFWVDEDGSGCYSEEGSGAVYTSTTRYSIPSLSEDAITASRNDDGSWTVESVP